MVIATIVTTLDILVQSVGKKSVDHLKNTIQGEDL